MRLAPAPRIDRTIPERPSLDDLETKWANRWETGGTYRFNRETAREEVFSIDTPPPTVSGSLHIGHVFSYTHTDIIARYQRMTGKNVFYPMGWDDNGLPTERRVENYYSVRCDPTVNYNADFFPRPKPAKKRADYVPISRKNFIELCLELTAADEAAFEELWRCLGLSVDWSMTYTTIDARSQRASQRAFLRNLAREEVYLQEAPCLWDTTFQTAVAQAELEDRDCQSANYQIAFRQAENEAVPVLTTRPELIVSCVALVAHPDDVRYQLLFGKTVRTPVFEFEVPILAHTLADPEKGTGIAMICTFGDVTDVTWWRELVLPTRSVIGYDGRLASETPEWLETNQARANYTKVAGKTAGSARNVMVECLDKNGDLISGPDRIIHPVKFFEKGDRPLEIITTRQWYIRNGGRDEVLRSHLLKRGCELDWYPAYMQVRYDNWVSGLNGDWLVSRQRYFGVPIPIWYALNAEGKPDYDNPILPDESVLPIDPQSDVPEGYTAEQRQQPGGFSGDPDIMDTWATSSLSPQIATGWVEDPELFATTFPMDLRPQAHEIIRTWLFSSVVRSHFEHQSVPWSNAALSGWILDPDRKKMSKSKGNVVTPMGLLKTYGSDGVRYWAASARPGADTAFDEKKMKVGRRLAVKLLNASRFCLSFKGNPRGPVTDPVDAAMLGNLSERVDECTGYFNAFDYARALESVERFFWWFCDDYLELVKVRAYSEGNGAASAGNALSAALSSVQRLLAPFLPFTAEETWSWWMPGSVHLASWPSGNELRDLAGDWNKNLTEVASDVLRDVRRLKSDAYLSMKTDLATATVIDSSERLAVFDLAESDLRNACRTGKFIRQIGDPRSVEIAFVDEGDSR